jgi:lipopolysaccharide export system protein LptA
MSWQRQARWAVALIGVGTAVALFVYTRPRQAPPPAPKPPSTTDPAATSQSSGGVNIRYVGTNMTTERYRLEHQGQKSFADGHIEWEKVHVIFHDDGTEVWADMASGKPAPKETQAPASLDLKKVRLKTGEGAAVEGESATYDDTSGLWNMPGPVTFSRGRMSGTGEGATFERDAGVFRLLAKAHVIMATDAANPDPVDAQSDTLVFNRATKAMQLDANARITRSAEAMTANRATLYLSEDEQWFRLIELRGQSRVEPLPGKKSDTPVMRADDIDLAFYEGTQVLEHGLLTRQANLTIVNAEGGREVSGETVSFDTAHNGSTLTRLSADRNVEVKTPASATGPSRQINAAQLSGTGDEKNGLTKAVFTGGVTFVETTRAAGGRAASSRTGRSQTLTLMLKGQLDAIDEALFERDAVFTDGQVEGRADVGRYFESPAKLVLQPDTKGARRAPHVTHGSNTVDAADRIEVILDTDDLFAFGDVKTKTVSSSSAGAKPRAASLFNGTDPVYGFASEFRYTDAKGEGVYLGSPKAQAEVRQGDSSVKADSIKIVDETQDLSALGKVQSTFLLTDAASKTETRYELTGDTMDYKDSERAAIYTGKRAELKTVKRGTASGSNANTLGETIVLTLAKDSRTVDTLDARGLVYSTMGDGQEARADTLHYESRTDKYTLTGKAGRPLVIRTRDAAGKCAETTQAFLVYYTPGADAPTIPGNGNPAGSYTTGIPCGGSLRD